MKTAYLDCSSGISGNMLLGTLIDAGVPFSHLVNEIKRLKLSGYKILKSQKSNGAVFAAYVEVICKEEKKPRSLKDIKNIINKSKLSANIKSKSIKIFSNLATAEAQIHKCDINKIHFHEVGAMDAIIDIVGTVICLEYLGIEEIFCSPINVGEGKTKCAHGILPVPSPATTQLLQGFTIYSSGIKKELATPTGAAILSALAKPIDSMPRLKVLKIGLGAGGYDLKVQPNFLRIIIGEKELRTIKDSILQIETNIDDMNPLLWDKTIADIMKAGALDAYIEPIIMKKKRKAIKLTVLCPIELKDRIVETIFKKTTTFGVRVFLVNREILSRSFKTVKTKYGKARIKIGKLGNKIVTVAPEFEDYKKLAEKHKVPVGYVYREILKFI